jgi:hypothetical protein
VRHGTAGPVGVGGRRVRVQGHNGLVEQDDRTGEVVTGGDAQLAHGAGQFTGGQQVQRRGWAWPAAQDASGHLDLAASASRGQVGARIWFYRIVTP